MPLDPLNIFDPGLIACALVGAAVFLGWPLLRRTAPPDNAGLLDDIIAQQSPSRLRKRRPVPQLAALEGHLRNAILDPGARERLVNDAVRTTAGDRAAAIGKVLADLHDDDKRWA